MLINDKGTDEQWTMKEWKFNAEMLGTSSWGSPTIRLWDKETKLTDSCFFTCRYIEDAKENDKRGGGEVLKT